jgi:hypothetical protein
MNSSRHFGNKKSQITFALCVALVILSAYFLNLPAGILNEPFHYGEYFTSLTSLLSTTSTAHQLTIHGSLDYIPELLARAIFPADAYFFPTWLIYRLLDFLAVVFLLAIALQITTDNEQRFLVLLGVAIAAPFMVGYRDVVLLLSIYLYLFVQSKSNIAIRMSVEILFGLVVAFGFYWSFDRGIAGVVSLGAASCISAYRSQKYIVSLVVFSAAIAFFSSSFEALSLANYWENVKFLAATSANWSYALKGNALILAAFLVLSNISANWLLWTSLFKSKALGNHFENALFLSLLSLILLKIGINRADTVHILWGLWGPVLIALYWQTNSNFDKLTYGNIAVLVLTLVVFSAAWDEYRLLALEPINILMLYGIITIFFEGAKHLAFRRIVAILLVLPTIMSIDLILSGIAKGEYRWTGYHRALPSNEVMATDGVRWVSRKLKDADANCVLDLSNNGVINGLTNLPSCTRFSYLVYADQRYEEEIIASIESRMPNAIVYSSTYWSFRIDGRSMHSRFPALNEFLLKRYSKEECELGYCVRYLEVAK